MYFTTKCKFPQPNLQIVIQPSEWVPTYKFLRITLDSCYLTFRPHIANLVQAGTSHLNLFHSLSSTCCGAERKALLRFYKAIIRHQTQTDLCSRTVLRCQQNPHLDPNTIQTTALWIALEARRSYSSIPLNLRLASPHNHSSVHDKWVGTFQ